MTTQLAGLQPLGGGVTTGRAVEMRTDAAALRRDIQEAAAHIDRLQQRYIDLASAVGALTRA